MEQEDAIFVQDVSKQYGAVRALDRVDLRAPTGRVTALLGPNGAGKTTLVRVLTTLVPLDSGTARVAGVDVRDARALRETIGLAGQYAAVDAMLTGRENLELVAGLHGQTRHSARTVARRLLDRFQLTDAADRRVKTYSGGMRRRLDLAASLVNHPPVLLLDEPTTGLDVTSRQDLWRVIEELVVDGTTVLLTTQYLEEADRLADTIVVIDQGRNIAQGSADELKDRMGGDVLDVRVAAGDTGAALAVLSRLGASTPETDTATGRLSLTVPPGSNSVVEAVRLLDDASIAVTDLALRRPTLDDVFIRLTVDARSAA